MEEKINLLFCSHFGMDFDLEREKNSNADFFLGCPGSQLVVSGIGEASLTPLLDAAAYSETLSAVRYLESEDMGG